MKKPKIKVTVSSDGEVAVYAPELPKADLIEWLIVILAMYGTDILTKDQLLESMKTGIDGWLARKAEMEVTHGR